MGRSLSVITEPAGIVYLQENAALASVAWLAPFCDASGKCFAWCSYDGQHANTNIHHGGGNLVFADGHAKYRTLMSMRSSDFGLQPNWGVDPHDSKPCDVGLTRDL
jgi:prepilin-type processing-associated H-X9-DG protein